MEDLLNENLESGFQHRKLVLCGGCLRLWTVVLLIFPVCINLRGKFKGLKWLAMVLNFFGMGASKAENGLGVVFANWLVEKVAMLKDKMIREWKWMILSEMLLGR